MANSEGVEGSDVLAGLRCPALIGRDHEEDRRDRTGAREHVGREPLVPRHIDECDLFPGGQRRPRVSEIDRHAPAPLLRPPIRLHPRERPHECRLAVVDVTSRRDHLHASTASTI